MKELTTLPCDLVGHIYDAVYLQFTSLQDLASANSELSQDLSGMAKNFQVFLQNRFNAYECLYKDTQNRF